MPERRTLPTLMMALLTALWLAAPATPHAFNPSQAAGIDVFLDQGPAVLLIDGGTCKAEMLFESNNPTLATVGTNSTSQASFALKVYGQHAGLTGITVTVNDGVDDHGDPCGEGGHVFAFAVRVWPSKAAYKKKLKQVIGGTLKLLGAVKEKLPEFIEQAQAALDDFKLSELAGLPPAPLGSALSIQTLFGTADGWNGVHAQLQMALEQAAAGTGEALVECGFTEPFVLDAGFKPAGLAYGDGEGFGGFVAQATDTATKTLEKLDKATKSALKKVRKATEQAGAPADVTYVMPTSRLPGIVFPALEPAAKGPPIASPQDSVLTLGVVFSTDVQGGEPTLHATGRGIAGRVLTVSVSGAEGPIAEDAAVLVDDDGSFQVSFTEGIPRGLPVNVEVIDPDTGARDAVLLHVAHYIAD